jgi:putative hydrolase of the HAD superfamily
LQLIGGSEILISAQLFTNSDRAHMKRALERLGVDEAVFDDVVCFETMNPHLFGEARDEQRAAAAAGGEPPVVVLKPSVDAIVAGLRVAGTNPRRTVTSPNCLRVCSTS